MLFLVGYLSDRKVSGENSWSAKGLWAGIQVGQITDRVIIQRGATNGITYSDEIIMPGVSCPSGLTVRS